MSASYPRLVPSIFSYGGQQNKSRREEIGRIVDPEQLQDLSIDELQSVLAQYRAMSNAWIRDQVLDNRRRDILCALLSLEVKKMHFQIASHRQRFRESMVLAFRGAGKSTVGTEVDSIGNILVYPDVRIQFASKSTTNSKGFLRSVRTHLENERLVEIFGPQKGDLWSESAIEVCSRTKAAKEPTISCVGLESTVASRHYDIQYVDDLVDEENARTPYMRDRTQTFYYKTLDPCLEPPEVVYHRGRAFQVGQRHISGTFYHFKDLYHHLRDNEYKGKVLYIRCWEKVYDPKKRKVLLRSPWPEKFPISFFRRKKKEQGIIIFNSQYLMDTEAMKGEVFQYDQCQVVDAMPAKSSMTIHMGVDLAVSEKDQKENAMFAMAVIGHDRRTNNYYGLAYYQARIPFPKQTQKIIIWNDRWKPSRIGIEKNGYQKGQCQQIKMQRPDVPVVPIHTDVDPMTRAWRLNVPFEDGRFYFLKEHQLWIEHMVLFPGGGLHDLMDATYNAYQCSVGRVSRKSRGNEPGVI